MYSIKNFFSEATSRPEYVLDPTLIEESVEEKLESLYPEFGIDVSFQDNDIKALDTTGVDLTLNITERQNGTGFMKPYIIITAETINPLNKEKLESLYPEFSIDVSIQDNNFEALDTNGVNLTLNITEKQNDSGSMKPKPNIDTAAIFNSLNEETTYQTNDRSEITESSADKSLSKGINFKSSTKKPRKETSEQFYTENTETLKINYGFKPMIYTRPSIIKKKQKAKKKKSKPKFGLLDFMNPFLYKGNHFKNWQHHAHTRMCQFCQQFFRSFPPIQPSPFHNFFF